MLTKVLYERRGNLELDPARFKQMIEEVYKVFLIN
jgi:hypothetical protein